MMVIEVNRSYHNEQRKLLTDSTKRVIGIRQELYAARPIIYLHTALSWHGEEEGLPDNPLDITENIAFAIATFERAAATIRRLLPECPERVMQLAEIYVALDRLEAIAAPEMIMKAGKWYIVTEKNDEKRRKTAYPAASPRPSP